MTFTDDSKQELDEKGETKAVRMYSISHCYTNDD